MIPFAGTMRVRIDRYALCMKSRFLSMPGITCVVCLTNDSVVAPVVAETRTVRPVLRRAELGAAIEEQCAAVHRLTVHCT